MNLYGKSLLFPPVCPLCGRPTPGLLCPDCARRENEWSLSRYRLATGNYHLLHLMGAAALCRYRGPVRHAVRRMKYGGEPWRAAGFARLMASRIFLL